MTKPIEEQMKYAISLVGLLKDHFGLVKPIRGVEVGVWRGKMSRYLLNELPRLTLWMVDSWGQLGDEAWMRRKQPGEIEAAKMEAIKSTQFNKRVVIQATSVDAAESLSDSRFHFGFIDACHMYESVKDDITAWWPLILPNGILAGHDYDGQGDRKRGWGVKRAVDEAFGDKVQVLPGNVWWVVK